VVDLPAATVDRKVTIGQAIIAQGSPTMKSRILALSAAVMVAATFLPAARSQDFGDAILNRMVSWVTGDPAVMDQPIPVDNTPKNYAADSCCADGTCGCCRRCCC